MTVARRRSAFSSGTRRYEMTRPEFPAGTTLRIEAHCDFIGVDGLGTFACTVTKEHGHARAQLSVFEPPDLSHYVSSLRDSAGGGRRHDARYRTRDRLGARHRTRDRAAPGARRLRRRRALPHRVAKPPRQSRATSRPWAAPPACSVRRGRPRGRRHGARGRRRDARRLLRRRVQCRHRARRHVSRR